MNSHMGVHIGYKVSALMLDYLGSNLSPTKSCMGKLLQLSMPHVSFKNGENNSNHLIGLL